MGRIGEFIGRIGHHIKKHWPTIKGIVGDVVGKIFPGNQQGGVIPRVTVPTPPSQEHYLQNQNPPHNPYEVAPAPAPPPTRPTRPTRVHYIRGVTS